MDECKVSELSKKAKELFLNAPYPEKAKMIGAILSWDHEAVSHCLTHLMLEWDDALLQKFINLFGGENEKDTKGGSPNP